MEGSLKRKLTYISVLRWTGKDVSLGRFRIDRLPEIPSRQHELELMHITTHHEHGDPRSFFSLGSQVMSN